MSIREQKAIEKHRLYREQRGYCAGCAKSFELRNLELDHIVPRSKGGTDHSENLQLLCNDCNRKKGNRSMEYLRGEIQYRELIEALPVQVNL